MAKAIKRIYRNYRKLTVGDKVELFSTLLGFAILVWGLVSWFEIGFNSCTYGHEYSKSNLICIIFSWFNL